MSRILVYHFGENMGGLADMIKFLFHTVTVSVKFQMTLKIDITHAIKRFLTINPLYQWDQTLSLKTVREINESDRNHHFSQITDPLIVIKPTDYYAYNINYDLLCDNDFKNMNPNNFTYDLKQYMSFTNEINDQLQLITPKNDYICIHVRLGDKYLEIAPHRGFIYWDDRNVQDDEAKIRKIIASSSPTSTPIYLLADNNAYKIKFKQQFEKLNIFTNQIFNISGSYNSPDYDEGIKQAIVEFLFLTNAKQIHALTYSGFSLISSLIGQVPLFKYY